MRMRLRMLMWWLVVRRFGVVVVRLVGSLCVRRLRSRAGWRCRLCLGLATPWCGVWCVVCGLGGGSGVHVSEVAVALRYAEPQRQDPG